MSKRQMEKQLKGIGGWLIIPILGFLITAFLHFLEIIELIQIYYLEDIYFFLIIDFLILIYFSFTLYNILKKKKLAIKLSIIAVIITTIENLIVGNYYAIISFVIWIPYFIKSKRVKNTFVR